jgi:oxygen-independent coproporphyrinogen-3 oxidase
MYGLPDLAPARWTASVEGVLAWRPEHLSAYGLSLDAGSLWGTTGVDGLPGEDAVIAQYWTLAGAAARHGYEHYEISNYARPGCRSRHNQLYWARREYLGLGPAACGFLGDVRYRNDRSVERYRARLAAGVLPIVEHERLTERQRLGERLMLGLRTADGVPGAWLDARGGADAGLRARLALWRREGLLASAGDHVRLTERGFLVSDALFVELL